MARLQLVEIKHFRGIKELAWQPISVAHSVAGAPFWLGPERHCSTHQLNALFTVIPTVTVIPTLWTKLSTTTAVSRPLESVEQRWFVGAHANVGGGYPSDPLSQPSLNWMISRAERLGLAFVSAVVPDDLAKASIADSYGDFLKGWYRRWSSPHMPPINAGPVATGKPGEIETAINETIDGSVFDRYRNCADSRPDNLLDWAKRAGIDIGDLRGAVLASNPSIPVS